jgi:cyclophilin family peptidyl-prolyl cis-trans isomerase
MKAFMLWLSAFLFVGALIGCSQEAGQDGAQASDSGKANQTSGAVQPKGEALGTIVLELYPDKAPKTVAQIVKLIQDGFYEGQRIHRVDPGVNGMPWVVQWGDPQSKKDTWQYLRLGTQGSGNPLPFEANDLKMAKGILAMASTGAKVGGDSQMFLLGSGADQQTFDALQGNYCIFGKAVSGVDLIDQLQVGDQISMKVVSQDAGAPVRVEMQIFREKQS